MDVRLNLVYALYMIDIPFVWKTHMDIIFISVTHQRE
jgi:hypothetical protein